MFITALCPTFRHPDLLENTLWLWDQQDYPADQRYLIIHDAGGFGLELARARVVGQDRARLR